jgi:hypothetical protein
VAESKHWLRGVSEAGPYVGLGFQFLAAILLFTGGGYWLDATLQTVPGFTLLGAALSFATIVYILMRVVRASTQDGSASGDEASAGGPSGGYASENAPGEDSPEDDDPSRFRGGPDFHSGHKRRISDED